MSNDAVILPLSIFIVDDEAPARARLKDLLADCDAQLSLQVVGEASNGQEALDKLAEVHAEVVLMDIRMPQMTGIELARHLNKLEQPPVIIFTTAYDTYAVQAFEQRAIDYLLKPIRLGRLFEALSRARCCPHTHRSVAGTHARSAYPPLGTRARQSHPRAYRRRAVSACRDEICHRAHSRARIPCRRIPHRDGARVLHTLRTHPP